MGWFRTGPEPRSSRSVSPGNLCPFEAVEVSVGGRGFGTGGEREYGTGRAGAERNVRRSDVGKGIGSRARVCLHGSTSMPRLRRSGCRKHSVEPHRCEVNRYTAVVEMLMGMQNGFDIPSFGNQGPNPTA